MSVPEIFSKGGPVVWILLAYSIIAFAIVLERYLHFFRIGRLPQAFSSDMEHASKVEDVQSLIKGLRGPEVAVLRGLLHAHKQGVLDLVRVASRIGSWELQRLQKGFRTLSILGDTAPLLGLFGTITGMIKAFMVIDEMGGKVDAQMLAGGIWEAMLTTGVGLAVALPILFLLHWLEGRAERHRHAMQNYASMLIETLPHKNTLAVIENVEP
ncbi:MAG: MotA/TolQ/ExbB proton channel family protein [Gammaproteobacteria bacterium]|nr:MotA/TolQ/ExbB proton channel family protein [Gammaproteobacteria bacterium]